MQKTILCLKAMLSFQKKEIIPISWMYNTVTLLKVFLYRYFPISLILFSSLFGELNFSVFSWKLLIKDHVTKEPIKDYILSIRRSGLDPALLKKAESDVEVNSFVFGRSDIVYTKYLPYGPYAGGFYVKDKSSVDIPEISEIPGHTNQYLIQIRKPGYLPVSFILKKGETSPVKDEVIELTAVPSLGSAEILVKDQDGNPVKNARVFLNSYYHSYEGRTDFHGLWVKPRVFSGEYRIAVVGPEKYGKKFIRNITIEQGDHLEEEVEIPRIKGGIVLLSFKNSQGLPFSGAQIKLEGKEIKPFVEPPDFSDHLVLYSPEHNKINKYNSLRSFISSEHANIENGTDPFRDINTKKIVQVVQPSQSNAQVSSTNPYTTDTIHDDSMNELLGDEPNKKFEGRTNAQGELSVPNLHEGKYKVYAYDEDGNVTGEYNLVVVAGIVQVIDFKVSPATSPVTFNVQDELGYGIESVACYVPDILNFPVEYSNRPGNVRFAGLSKGDYKIRCERSGYIAYEKKVSITKDEISKARLNSDYSKDLGVFSLLVKKQKAVILAMSLKSKGGTENNVLGSIEPIKGAQLTSSPRIPDLSWKESPDVPGMYEVSNIPVGKEYSLNFLPPSGSKQGQAQVKVRLDDNGVNEVLSDTGSTNKDIFSLIDGDALSNGWTGSSRAVVYAKLSLLNGYYAKLKKIASPKELSGLSFDGTASSVGDFIDIRGFVFDWSGEAVEGASISIQTVDDRIYGTVTGSGGAFNFKSVPPEYYSVVSKKAGYNPGRGYIAIGPDGLPKLKWKIPMLKPSDGTLDEILARNTPNPAKSGRYSVSKIFAPYHLSAVSIDLSTKGELSFSGHIDVPVLDSNKLPQLVKDQLLQIKGLDEHFVHLPFVLEKKVPSSYRDTSLKLSALKSLLMLAEKEKDGNVELSDLINSLPLVSDNGLSGNLPGQIKSILTGEAVDKNALSEDLAVLFKKILLETFGDPVQFPFKSTPLLDLGHYELALNKGSFDISSSGSGSGSLSGFLLGSASLALSCKPKSSRCGKELPESLTFKGLSLTNDKLDFSGLSAVRRTFLAPEFSLGDNFSFKVPAAGIINIEFDGDNNKVFLSMTGISVFEGKKYPASSVKLEIAPNLRVEDFDSGDAGGPSLLKKKVMDKFFGMTSVIDSIKLLKDDTLSIEGKLSLLKDILGDKADRLLSGFNASADKNGFKVLFQDEFSLNIDIPMNGDSKEDSNKRSLIQSLISRIHQEAGEIAAADSNGNVSTAELGKRIKKAFNLQTALSELGAPSMLISLLKHLQPFDISIVKGRDKKLFSLGFYDLVVSDLKLLVRENGDIRFACNVKDKESVLKRTSNAIKKGAKKVSSAFKKAGDFVRSKFVDSEGKTEVEAEAEVPKGQCGLILNEEKKQKFLNAVPMLSHLKLPPLLSLIPENIKYSKETGLDFSSLSWDINAPEFSFGMPNILNVSSDSETFLKYSLSDHILKIDNFLVSGRLPGLDPGESGHRGKIHIDFSKGQIVKFDIGNLDVLTNVKAVNEFIQDPSLGPALSYEYIRPGGTDLDQSQVLHNGLDVKARVVLQTGVPFIDAYLSKIGIPLEMKKLKVLAFTPLQLKTLFKYIKTKSYNGPNPAPMELSIFWNSLSIFQKRQLNKYIPCEGCTLQQFSDKIDTLGVSSIEMLLNSIVKSKIDLERGRFYIVRDNAPIRIFTIPGLYSFSLSGLYAGINDQNRFVFGLESLYFERVDPNKRIPSRISLDISKDNPATIDLKGRISLPGDGNVISASLTMPSRASEASFSLGVAKVTVTEHSPVQIDFRQKDIKIQNIKVDTAWSTIAAKDMHRELVISLDSAPYVALNPPLGAYNGIPLFTIDNIAGGIGISIDEINVDIPNNNLLLAGRLLFPVSRYISANAAKQVTAVLGDGKGRLALPIPISGKCLKLGIPVRLQKYAPELKAIVDRVEKTGRATCPVSSSGTASPVISSATLSEMSTELGAGGNYSLSDPEEIKQLIVDLINKIIHKELLEIIGPEGKTLFHIGEFYAFHVKNLALSLTGSLRKPIVALSDGFEAKLMPIGNHVGNLPLIKVTDLQLKKGPNGIEFSLGNLLVTFAKDRKLLSLGALTHVFVPAGTVLGIKLPSSSSKGVFMHLQAPGETRTISVGLPGVADHAYINYIKFRLSPDFGLVELNPSPALLGLGYLNQLFGLDVEIKKLTLDNNNMDFKFNANLPKIPFTRPETPKERLVGLGFADKLAIPDEFFGSDPAAGKLLVKALFYYVNPSSCDEACKGALRGAVLLDLSLNDLKSRLESQLGDYFRCQLFAG